jgi:hypothetical protein
MLDKPVSQKLPIVKDYGTKVLNANIAQFLWEHAFQTALASSIEMSFNGGGSKVAMMTADGKEMMTP